MRLADITKRIAIQNILIATDFSPASEVCLSFVKSIARHYGSRLFAAHTIPPAETSLVPPEYWGACQQAIDEAAAREMEAFSTNLREFPHESLIRHGDVWETLSDLIGRFHIDLLAMGTHGRSGLGRLLMGSVAEEAFRQAPCPVFTVGPNVRIQSSWEAEFKQIIFATDFSAESLAAAPYALSLAEEFQANITFLHVITGENGRHMNPELLRIDRMQDLYNLIPSETELWCKPECMVTIGEPAEAILQVGDRAEADLIVLGVKPATKHLTAATHLAAGIAHKVVALAGCPVLTVHG